MANVLDGLALTAKGNNCDRLAKELNKVIQAEQDAAKQIEEYDNALSDYMFAMKKFRQNLHGMQASMSAAQISRIEAKVLAEQATLRQIKEENIEFLRKKHGSI